MINCPFCNCEIQRGKYCRKYNHEYTYISHYYRMMAISDFALSMQYSYAGWNLKVFDKKQSLNILTKIFKTEEECVKYFKIIKNKTDLQNLLILC